MVAVLVVLFLALPQIAAAQLRIDPDPPVLGKEITIVADPSVPVSLPAEPFGRTDVVYARIGPNYGGWYEDLGVPLSWNGKTFVGRITIPSDCVWIDVSLYTAEKFLGISKVFTPLKGDGQRLPGALVSSARHAMIHRLLALER